MLTAQQGRLRPRSSPSPTSIVELIGRHRPRPRLRARGRCSPASTVVTANKQLVAQHGPELVAAAQEGGAQLRFEAAVAGGHPGDQGRPGELRRRPRSTRSPGSSTAPPTTSSPRWRRAGAPTTRRWRRPRSSATPRPIPTEDVGGADAAAKMAILARLAFRTPVTRSTRSPTRASSRSSPTTSPTPRSSASR